MTLIKCHIKVKSLGIVLYIIMLMIVAGLAFYAITLLLDMCELTGFKVRAWPPPFLNSYAFFLTVIRRNCRTRRWCPWQTDRRLLHYDSYTWRHVLVLVHLQIRVAACRENVSEHWPVRRVPGHQWRFSRLSHRSPGRHALVGGERHFLLGLLVWLCHVLHDLLHCAHRPSIGRHPVPLGAPHARLILAVYAGRYKQVRRVERCRHDQKDVLGAEIWNSLWWADLDTTLRRLVQLISPADACD